LLFGKKLLPNVPRSHIFTKQKFERALKRHILFALAGLICHYSYPQLLIKIDLGFDICNLRGGGVISDNSIVLGGFCVRNDSLQNQAIIAKVNSQGELLGSIEFGGVNDDNLLGLVVLPQLNLVVGVGERIVPGAKQGMIIACDTNLNLLWSKYMALPGVDVSFKSVAVYEGNVFAFGMVVPLIAPVVSGSFYIYKCNILGDSLHAASGNVYGFDVGNAIHITGNSNLPLIVTGDAISPGKVEPYHAFVDAVGNFTVGETWVQDGLGAGFQASTLGSDNAIYLGGEGYPPSSDVFDFLIAKINAGGVPLWQKWMHTPGTNAIFSLTALDNNMIAFTGYSNGNNTAEPIDAILGLADTSGQLLKLEYIINAGVDIGYSVFEVGGKVYVAGTFADGNNNKFGIWGIEKTDFVNVQPSTCNIPINIYPNPVNNDLIIRTGTTLHNIRVVITDVLGKTVFEQSFDKINREITINRPEKCAPGIYFMHLTAQGVQFSKKLIFAGR
jgi:hypothetical protein